MALLGEIFTVLVCCLCCCIVAIVASLSLSLSLSRARSLRLQISRENCGARTKYTSVYYESTEVVFSTVSVYVRITEMRLRMPCGKG